MAQPTGAFMAAFPDESSKITCCYSVGVFRDYLANTPTSPTSCHVINSIFPYFFTLLFLVSSALTWSTRKEAKRGTRHATYWNGDGGWKRIFLLFQFLLILFNSPVGGVEYTEGEFGYIATDRDRQRERDVDLKGWYLLCVYVSRGRGRCMLSCYGGSEHKETHFAIKKRGQLHASLSLWGLKFIYIMFTDPRSILQKT